MGDESVSDFFRGAVPYIQVILREDFDAQSKREDASAAPEGLVLQLPQECTLTALRQCIQQKMDVEVGRLWHDNVFT